MTNQLPDDLIPHIDGHYIKLSSLPLRKQKEHELVLKLWETAEHLNQKMAEFKYTSMNEVQEFVNELIQKGGIKKPESFKGNITVYSACGNYKIERGMRELVAQDANVEAARQLFLKYVSVKEKDMDDEQREIIDIFQGKNDKISPNQLIRLLSGKSKHPLYQQAKKALEECVLHSGSKAYLRFYRNIGDNAWEPMPMQFSSIPGLEPVENNDAVTTEN